MKQNGERDLFRWALLGVFAAAAGLRFFRIGEKGLWVDEGYSAVVTKLPLGQLVEGVFKLENHPPLYFMLLKAWSVWGFLSGSDAYLRGFSAFASLAIVWGVYKLGRLVFGKWEGLVAGGLVAVSAYQVYFAQEVRLYTVVGALGVWATYFMVKGLREEGRVRDWVVYSVLSAAALWTFYYAVFLVAAQGAVALVYLAARRREESGGATARRWVVSQMVIVLTFVPLVFVMLRRGGMGGAAGVGIGMGGSSLIEALAQYAAWVGTPLPERSLAAGLMLLGLFPVWAALMGMRKKTLAVVGMVMLFGLPFGMVALFPYKPFGFEGKHLFFVTPFWAVLAGFGVLRFKVAGALACAALVAGNVFALAAYYPDSYQKENWDWAAEYVGERFGSRDAIYCNPAWGVYSFERYWTSRYAGELVRGRAPTLLDDTDGNITEGAFREMISRYQRVWLVEVENKAIGPDRKVGEWFREMMRAKMEVARRFAVGKISIVLFQRKERERDEDIQRDGDG
jgi:hypothetical protein